LLLSVPLGVVTSTVPVVAPFGTVVVISVLETNPERPCGTVKGDARCAGQIGSQDNDLGFRHAGCGQRFDERTEAQR
jgi:hypothetical protein